MKKEEKVELLTIDEESNQSISDNSKNNKKSGQKTRAELRKMKTETANEVGFSKESRKLGKDKPRDENKQA